jgi:hypothetical protein
MIQRIVFVNHTGACIDEHDFMTQWLVSVGDEVIVGGAARRVTKRVWEYGEGRLVIWTAKIHEEPQ